MKKTVYALLGDYYHHHDIIYPAVKKAVESLGGDVELFEFDLPQFGDVLEKNPDLIIIDRENRLNPQDEINELMLYWLTRELDDKIDDYVMQGGSFLAMHASLASYDIDSKFIKMLKGYFVSHPKDNCPVRFVSNDKLPFEGAGFDYEVMDEHYFLHCDEENTNLFMTSESVHGKSYGGWNHAHGNGRVMCIIPTHRKEGFEHEETVRLLAGAAKWCLGL